jgi:uncharacterized protein (TIGR00730 family)
MDTIRSIAVFCSASMGGDEAYARSAEQFGKILAQRNIQLVYGGSKAGLMGILADAVLKNGGKVIGILPRFLTEKKEIAHKGLTELIYVESLMERKKKMSEMAQASVVLPGGFGTMDEMFEMLTWSQLNLHQHRVGVLNINGLYDGLEQLFRRMSEEKLLHRNNSKLFAFSKDPQELMDKLLELKLMDNEMANGRP